MTKSLSIHKSIFFRYMVIILIACILPTVILSSIYYFTVSQSLEDKVFKGINEMTNLIGNTVDMSLSSINYFPEAIFSDKRILSFLGGNFDYIECKEIRKILIGFVHLNSIVDNLLVYSDIHPYIVSAKGVYPVEDTVTTPKIGNDPIIELFNVSNTNMLYYYNYFPVLEEPMKILAMKFPSYTDLYGTSYTIAITINGKNLIKPLLNSSIKNKEYARNILLTDYNNDLLYILNNHDGLDVSEIMTSLDLKNNQGISKITLQDKKYVVSYRQSPITGYGILNIVPQEYIIDGIGTYNAIYIIILITLLLFIGISIFIFTHSIYTPIRQLRELAESVLSGHSYKHNEIGGIDAALKYLISRINELNYKFEVNKDAVKYKIIKNIINGQYTEEEDFYSETGQCGINFPYKHYFVVIFTLRNFKSNTEQFIQKAEEIINRKFIGYGMSFIDNSELVFIVNSDSHELQWLSSLMEQIKKEIEPIFNCTITIGIGNIYDDFHYIGKSYIEATEAINYRLILGEKVITYDIVNLLSKNENKEKYLQLEDFGDLYSAILEGDLTSISAILDDTVAYIKNNYIEPFYVRCMCFEIINSVLKALSRLSDRRYSYDGFDIMDLGSFVTVDELIEAIRQIGNHVHTYLENRTNFSHYNIKLIKEYIHQNFDKQAFSIQDIATAFNLSPSMLSQYFKLQTNRTIIDYVTELRIEKAKILLTDTDMYIKDIVESVGYYSTSSFIKKFKQITGYTPGEYRDARGAINQEFHSL